MTQLMNTRTNEVVTLIKKGDGMVVIENSLGKQHKIQEGTFKRWYKPVSGVVGAVTGRTQSKTANMTAVPKTAVPSKGAKKELAPATKKVVIEKPVSTFNKDAAESEIIEICKKLNVEYIVNRTTNVIQFNKKNIAEMYFTKRGVRVYFNYQSIPNDVYQKHNLENVPAAWKWTLETKLTITDTIAKSAFKELLTLGRDYKFSQLVAKETKETTKKGN